MLCRRQMGADATDCEKLESPCRNSVLHRGVEVLQRLKVFHFGVFDTVRIATDARFLEFLKPQRQLAIRMF